MSSKTAGSLQGNLHKISKAWLVKGHTPVVRPLPGDFDPEKNPSYGYQTTINHTYEEYSFTPQEGANGAAFGSTVTFSIQNRAPVLFGNPLLVYTRGAISGATNPSFGPFEAFQCIKEVRGVYGNRVFWRKTGEEMYREWIKEVDMKKKFEHSRLIGGEYLQQDSALDNCRASASRKIQVELPMPWGEALTPFRLADSPKIQSLPDTIRIEIDFHSLTDCLRLDSGTAACTITAMSLKCQFAYLPPPAANALYAYGRSHMHGWGHKVTTKQYQANEAIASGVTEHSVKIRNLQNDVHTVAVLLQKNTEKVVTTGTIAAASTTAASTSNARFSRFRYYKPYKWEINDGANVVTDTLDLSDRRHDLYRECLYYKNAFSDPAYSSYFFGLDWTKAGNESKLGNHGYRTLSSYADPEVKLYFNPTALLNANDASHMQLYPNKFRGHLMTAADTSSDNAESLDYCFNTAGTSEALTCTIEAHVHNLIRHRKSDYFIVLKV